MKFQRTQIITVLLITLTIVLLGAIIFIGAQLTNQNVQEAPIAPKKTKAQQRDYNAVIPVNNSTGVLEVTPTTVIMPTPTSILLTENNIPSPTEIMLVNSVTPTITIASAFSPTVAQQIATTSPTQLSGLPKTGIISNGLFIFGAAGLLMFFSFIL